MLPRKSGAVLQFLLAGGTYRNPLGEYHSSILAGGTCRASIGSKVATMHSMGLHSALAIKRQRKRRDEQRRARERRFSQQSTESGMGESQSSFMSPRSSMRERARRNRGDGTSEALDSKVVSSIGMLHIGVVFLVLGGFLLVSGLIPSDFTSWDQLAGGGWCNELSAAGACAVIIGIFLIVLNRIITKREEDDLTEYVQRQLTRSRSGHRLVRDVETGGLTTKHSHRPRVDTGSSRLNGFDSSQELDHMGSGDALALDESPSPLNSPSMRSPPGIPPPMSPPPHHHLHTDLEKILEEECSEKGEDDCRMMERLNKEMASTGSSISPGTPSETRELLISRMYNSNMVRI